MQTQADLLSSDTEAACSQFPYQLLHLEVCLKMESVWCATETSGCVCHVPLPIPHTSTPKKNIPAPFGK